ncbi:MAG: SLBB domain-containing protein [Planctomycetales bacterium]
MPRLVTLPRSQAGFRCCAGIVLGMCALSMLAGCYSFPKPVVPSPQSGLNWLAQLVPNSPPQQPVNLELLRPAEAAEVIHRGDLLELTVWDLYEPGRPQTAPLRVEGDGKSSPPLLSAQRLEGLTLTEAEKVVAEQYQTAEILLEPRILIRKLETSQCPVEVLGAVQRPGTVKLNRDQAAVYHALMAAGGLASNAGHHLQLVRYAPTAPKETETAPAKESAYLEELTRDDVDHKPEEKPEEKRVATLDTTLLRTPIQERWFDLTNVDECKELARIPLQEGDQITVREEATPIRITGQVKNPGTYSLPAGRGLDIVQRCNCWGSVDHRPAGCGTDVDAPELRRKNLREEDPYADPKQLSPMSRSPNRVTSLPETTPRAKVERVVEYSRRKSASCRRRPIPEPQ